MTCESYALSPRAQLNDVFFSAFYGIIDVLAVIPYYIELIMQQDTVSLDAWISLRAYLIHDAVRPIPVLNSSDVPAASSIQAVPIQPYYLTVRLSDFVT